ncbi:MAG: hypothetical protein FK731_01335 [Asgard group archaeon]|nr:hypothetical protein [Asgard group archaeon]
MTRKISVLACGGLGKGLGILSNELSIKLKEIDPSIKLLCTTEICTNEEKYQEIIGDSEVIIIDGCATRCATKLLESYKYKKTIRIYLPEESKKYGISIGKSIKISEEGRKLVDMIAKQIIKELKEDKSKKTPIIIKEFGEIDYYEVTYDKYHFRVPKKGYYFNENDCWVKPEGTTALLGISDYLQNKSSDVLFVDLPEVGTEVEQFDEAANYESVKALLSLISPVSGKIINVNRKLEEESDLLNTDPYEQGWILEIELHDFEEEKELLINGKDYFEYMKKKIEEEL